MLLSLLVIWSSVLLLYYYIKKRRTFILGSKLPGPKSYPIVGNALMFLGKPENTFKTVNELAKEHKNFMSIWLGHNLYVLIYGHKEAEILLKSSKNNTKADEYRFLKPWLGESILLSDGEKFRKNRKLIMPSFGISNLKEFFGIFNKHCKKLIEELEKECFDGEFDIYHYLKQCTMDSLLETSLGISSEILGQKAIEYAKATDNLGKCAHIRVYNVFLRNEILFKYSKLRKIQDDSLKTVHTLTERVIKERKKEFAQKKQEEIETGETFYKKWPIFLDRLLVEKHDDGSSLTDQDIEDEVSTIMFAGQDTTTSTVGFALSLLGIHLDIQEKVHKEIDEIFGESERPIAYEDIQNLTYLEQVVLETLRLYPSVPLIARKLSEDLVLDGYVVPKFTAVSIVVMLLHRNEAQFPNPDRFNPDHFLQEKIKERSPYSFLPFSAGQRTCVGQKYALILIKMMLCSILRKYGVSSKRKEKDFVLAAQSSLKRKDGFRISLKLRRRYVDRSQGEL